MELQQNSNLTKPFLWTILVLCLALSLAPASSARPQAAPLESSQSLQDPLAQARRELLAKLEKSNQNSSLLEQMKEIIHFLSEKPAEQPSGVLATMGPKTVPEWLYPNNTRLLTDRPTFSWQAVPKVQGYRVELFQGKTGSGQKLWEVNVSEAKLPYPSQQPSLDPGPAYIWKVWPEGAKEAATGQFQVAAAAEARAIEAEANNLEAELGKYLPRSQVLLLVGGFYSRQGYQLAAMNALHQARELDPDNPLIQATDDQIRKTVRRRAD